MTTAFRRESGFAVRACTERAKLGGTASLEGNGLGRAALELTAQATALLSCSLSLCLPPPPCFSLWLFRIEYEFDLGTG